MSDLSGLALAQAAHAWTAAEVGQVTLLALVSLAVYSAYVLIYWRDTCSKCEGKGGFPSPSGKYSRPCPRCAGKPRKVRLGARVLRGIGRALKSRDRG